MKATPTLVDSWRQCCNALDQLSHEAVKQRRAEAQFAKELVDKVIKEILRSVPISHPAAQSVNNIAARLRLFANKSDINAEELALLEADNRKYFRRQGYIDFSRRL